MNINFKLHSLKTNGLTNIVLFALLFSFYTGNAQTQFWSDNFEGSPSSGIRIPEENGGVGGPPMTSYFRLTDGSTVAQVVPFTGKEGTNYWAGEDHNANGTGFTVSGAEGAATNSPNNELQILWLGINIAGKTGLSFRGLLAANSTNEPWDNTQACISGVGTTNTDYIIVQYSIDGGPFINLVRFFNRGSASGTSDKYLYEDTNNDGCGDVGGLQLTNAFKEITKTIIGTGSTMSLKILVFSEGNNEEWAIDNFRLFETTSIPVVLNCPTNTTVASCQSQAAVNAAFTTWLATASASGGCSGVLTNNNVGAPAACGGSTTVTFTYTSTCAPLVTTCQATFTVVASPPVILTCPTNTTVASCQSQTAVNAAFTAWLATGTASGGCNGVLTNNNSGAPDACGGSTTVTFTYTSSCSPLITTCQATFTVSATSTPTPTFTNCNNTVSLGCNPASLPSCTGISSGGFGGAVTASNSCGSVPVSCSAGTIMVNGCNRSQVFTFTATACGITSTCTRTFNWTQVTPPSFNGSCSNGVINLGCNPVTLPACDPNITASNECGPISVTCNVGTIQVNGCNRQQTLTYVANAVGCGTFSTCIKIHNWQVTTAPVFANCDNTYDLGCNPATIPTCANVQTAPFGGAVTASNECGNVGGITCSEGAVTSNGCDRSKVFTFSVTACGFTSTCTRTFTWKVESLPIFDNCTTGLIDLGCNPVALPTCDASVTATSECGPATVVCTAGMITSNGCNRQQIFTYEATGVCGTNTCTRTYVWQESTPVILTCPINTVVPACQTQIAIDAAFTSWLASTSASGGCNGVLTNNNIGAPSACGGSTTVTFTYTSTCSPFITTCQSTFTVASSPTVILNCPMSQTEIAGQTQSAINAAFAAWLSTASASGGCNGVLINNNIGAPPATGGSTMGTFTYTSSCAPSTTTCQATFSVLSGLYQNMQTGLSFATLQAAINAAMPGQTIILLDNVSESNVVINNSVTIEANGFTLTIPNGTLSIPTGKSLTWKEDTLIIGPGASIVNDGTLANNGTINYQGGVGTFNNTGTYSGTGSFLGVMVNTGNVSPGN